MPTHTKEIVGVPLEANQVAAGEGPGCEVSASAPTPGDTPYPGRPRKGQRQRVKPTGVCSFPIAFGAEIETTGVDAEKYKDKLRKIWTNTE